MEKKREDRAVTELYDRTAKIPRFKVEGGDCKEPLDQPLNEAGGINEKNKPPSRKRSISDDDNPCTKPESGTCNVCNTPCTSCLHRMRVETDTCSSVGNCGEHFPCEDARTKSKPRNPNKTKPFDIGIVKQEGQGESSSCVTKDTKEKDDHKIDGHRESGSMDCKEESPKNKKYNPADSQEKCDSNFKVSTNSSACNEEVGAGLENCGKRDLSEKSHMQVQNAVEVKNQEAENNLVDVNICDICGDAGREELLATCSRCIDGAEHTYCMRVRLDKLPEGDWLCEECQLRDKSEKKKQRNTDTTPHSTSLSEKENKSEFVNSKNPFSRHNKLRISTDRAMYTSFPPPSPHKSFKEAISPGKSSNLSRQNSVKMEIGSSRELASPRKATNLCRENSIKIEICSPKGRRGVQNMKKSHVLSRSYSFSSVSSLRDAEKGQAEMRPPKGTMTKHLSFQNHTKVKVKSAVESPRTKQKTPCFSLVKPTEEARPFRRLIKCASLKETSSSCGTNNSIKLSKPLSPTVHVNAQMRAEREKSTLERKFFKGEVRTDVSAQRLSTIAKKPEHKAKESVPKKPECGSSCSQLEPALGEKKISKTVLTKQHQSNKNPRIIQPSKESDRKFNRLRTAVKTVVPEPRDGGNYGISDKLKVPLVKPGISPTGRDQKETSDNVEKHSKSTILDKIRVEKVLENVLPLTSSAKTEESACLNVISPNSGVQKTEAPKDMLSQSSSFKKERTDDISVNNTVAVVDKAKTPKEPRDGGNYGISDKLKVPLVKPGISPTGRDQKETSDNVEKHSKSTILDKIRVEKVLENVLPLTSSAKTEESACLNVISPNSGVQKTEAPKDMLSRSSSFKKERTDDISVNNTVAVVDKAKTPKDTLSRTKSLEKHVNSNGISADVKNVEAEPSMRVVDHSSQHGTPSETMVIPEEDFVWQGSFEILRARTQAYESFNGIQAHFSTHASPKVFEVVSKFSDKLKLEEVPWGTAWPVQFQNIEPNEEHVALFFFAKDLESYEVSYSRLLQSLVGDNLALRGDIFGAELLIFPSDKLPGQSQRWNSLLYLWGIFRARRPVLPKTILNTPRTIGGPSGNFPTKITDDRKLYKKLTICDNLPKPKVEDSAGSLDLVPEYCKKTVEQNTFTCLGSTAFHADQGTLHASYAACTTQVCVVKTEDAMASLPFVQKKMEENVPEVDSKILSMNKPTDAELKPGNKQAYLSERTSSEELGLKRKREHDGSQTETGPGSSTLLKKLASPKIHPFSIDLEKPAEACDAYSTEDVEDISFRNAEQYKSGKSVINVVLSDDDNAAEIKTPNLNLALGSKNPNQNEVRPLPLFPTVRSKEMEVDASLSLSLTIGPPNIEEEMEKPVVKQFLPEKPSEKAPLRLFGGYINP